MVGTLTLMKICLSFNDFWITDYKKIIIIILYNYLKSVEYVASVYKILLYLWQGSFKIVWLLQK